MWKASPGNSGTAAGLGSEFADIKFDPHAFFQYSAFLKRSLILVSLFFFFKSRLMLIPSIKSL